MSLLAPWDQSVGRPCESISPDVRVSLWLTSVSSRLIGVGLSWEGEGWKKQGELACTSLLLYNNPYFGGVFCFFLFFVVVVVVSFRKLGASEGTINQEIQRYQQLESVAVNDIRRDVRKKLRRSSMRVSAPQTFIFKCSLSFWNWQRNLCSC